MFGDILQPTHLLFVLVVALLVLGPKRLPEVAKSLGSGLRDFRQAISGEMSADHPDPSRHEWVEPPAEPESHRDTVTTPAPPAAEPPPELVLTHAPTAPDQLADAEVPGDHGEVAAAAEPAPLAEPAGATESRSEPSA
jgi:sec-independent protein translocase protein TatA